MNFNRMENAHTARTRAFVCVFISADICFARKLIGNSNVKEIIVESSPIFLYFSLSFQPFPYV